MHTETHTGLDSPKGTWWKPAHKSERVWVAIAFVWCMVLFAMMPFWHFKGGQNPTGIRTRAIRRPSPSACCDSPRSTRSAKTTASRS